MNSDDPKLTAYALDELDPAERAEIEQLLRDDPAALAEVEETKSFVAQLRHELKADAGVPLTDEQKATVLAAVDGQPEPFNIDLTAPPQSGRWMHRWLPIAAGIVIVASIAALTVNPLVQRKAARSSMDSPAPLPTEENAKFPQSSAPEPARMDTVSQPSEVRSVVAQVTPNPSRMLPEATTDFAPPQIPQQVGNASQPPAVFPTTPTNPRGDIAAVDISGNTRTMDKAIRRELPVDSGKLLAEAREAGNDAKKENEPLKLPAVTIAPPSSAPVAGNEGLATFSDTASSTITRSGSGTMTLSGGAVVTENSLAVMPAEKPASTTPSTSYAVNHPKPTTVTSLAKSERRRDLSPVTDEYAGPRRLFMQKMKDVQDGDYARVPEPSAPAPHPDPSFGNTEAYDAITDNAFLAVRENPLSTFSIDVDTASYANVRRFLNQQTRPPKGAVRIEELVNYFTYDYPQPEGDAPFSSTMEVATCPWAPEHRLVRIGLKGREIAKDKRPASNLVFLIDVSGSMQPENKLPLLKKSLRLLVDNLSPEDSVAIAVYAGASGTVLEPTSEKRRMREALDRLESGGSTNGAAGIQLAYRLAEQSFIKGGVNRVILATDGDFNVGVTSQSELTGLIERKAKTGVFLTVLGFGMDNLKDSTLEKLADKGNGNYAYIDTLNEGRKVLVEQMSGTLVTIAKDVKIQVEFNPSQVGAYRLIGYENRLLAKEDFNDDKKDAGEIGAGHTVTALYEVVPAGTSVPGTPAVDALKYQESAGPAKPGTRNQEPATMSELLTLKLRYKQPDGDTSKLLEFPLTDRGETWEKSSRDFRFAAAVAGFGMLLRESPHKGSANWDSVRELAMEGRGEDRSGYRGEFLTMIDKAKALTR